MQLTCPNCGDLIRANNMNVQEMVAVCANCNTVFPFKSPAEKNKRRKVKQPQNLALHDGQVLEMSFRTNWRLGSNQAFANASIAAGMMGFVSSILFSEFIAGEASLILSVGFALLALALIYAVGLIAYNRTHIIMNDEKITVKRLPLANPLRQAQTISLHGIESIKCEETAISKERNYDLPRYHVWAETVDGNRRPIVVDVTEEYAYFISQRLEERLHYDVSRLEDSDYDNNETILHSRQLNAEKESLYRG